MFIKEHKKVTQETIIFEYDTVEEAQEHYLKMFMDGYIQSVISLVPCTVMYSKTVTLRSTNFIDSNDKEPALVTDYDSSEKDVAFARTLIEEFEDYLGGSLPNAYKNRLVTQIRGFLKFGIVTGRQEVATLIYKELCKQNIDTVNMADIIAIVSRYISLYELERESDK